MAKKSRTTQKDNRSASLAVLTEAGPDARTEIALPGGFMDESAYKAPAGVIVKSMSPMIKLEKFPVGKVLVGVFTKCFKAGEFKNEDGTMRPGTGIEIVPKGAPVGIAIPLAATLRTGLEVVGTGNEAKSQYFGREVAIKKMPDRIPSKKGQDAWNFIVLIYQPEGGK